MVLSSLTTAWLTVNGFSVWPTPILLFTPLLAVGGALNLSDMRTLGLSLAKLSLSPTINSSNPEPSSSENISGATLSKNSEALFRSASLKLPFRNSPESKLL